MSTYDVRTRDVTLFLGTEAVSSSGEMPWLRSATAQEQHALRAQLEETRLFGESIVPGRQDWGELFRDPAGRQYRVMTVTREAPEEVWLRASSFLRLPHLS